MKKLTKTQWITFIVTLVSFAFTMIETNTEILNLGATGLAIVGFLKFTWDTYLSFSESNMVEFADEAAQETNYKTRHILSTELTTKEKLQAYVELKKYK